MLCHHWVKVTINDLNPVVSGFLLRQLNRVRQFREASLAIKLIISAKSENIVTDDLTSVLQKILLDGTWLLSNVLHPSRRENLSKRLDKKLMRQKIMAVKNTKSSTVLNH
jgi:hypothetical protein